MYSNINFCIPHPKLFCFTSLIIFIFHFSDCSDYQKLKEVSLRDLPVNGPDRDHNFGLFASCILILYIVVHFVSLAVV